MVTGLQTVNQQRKLSDWAELVSACRSSGLSVKTWCRENGVSEQTYYKWQRQLYELAQNQQENRSAEIMPQRISNNCIAVHLGHRVATFLELQMDMRRCIKYTLATIAQNGSRYVVQWNTMRYNRLHKRMLVLLGNTPWSALPSPWLWRTPLSNFLQNQGVYSKK